jgi:oligoribonuclease NrnB/cAMP/cGMP phosphodiesterase (DHH superfamily)
MRLVTRGDLDGLTCAVLITECEKIDDILLIHPQDVTDKRVAILEDDIMANLPYHPKCAKWFDHHLLTDSNEKPPAHFEGAYGLAPSAARVVWGYYIEKNPGLKRFQKLLEETDRIDAAQLTREDVLDPKDYILLGLSLDPRTGLGAYQEYFHLLLDALKKKDIADVMRMPEVVERVGRMRAQDAAFREATQKNSRLDGNVIITDFRNLEKLPIGNRFIVYTLFPEGNVSLRTHWGPSRQHVAATVGHSIFNRTCTVNVGELMSRYGGGGHKGAGTCLLPAATAEAQIAEIVAALKG